MIFIDPKRYVVTGGAGFIGSSLVRELLNLGHTVVVIDNFSSGKRGNLPIHPKLIVKDLDIRNSLYNAINGASGIFHLAADARISSSCTFPKHTIDVNVMGTFNVLETMRETGCKNIVYSASSSYYGINNMWPYIEVMQHNCLNPYALSKYFGEEMCKLWKNLYGINCIALKYFNVYGEKSSLDLGSYSPVIGLFFKQAFTGKNITVVGDGEQTRDFVYVDDVVNANILAMSKLEINENNINVTTFNIGSGSNIKIKDLATKIVRLVQDDVSHIIEIEHIADRPNECKDVLADIDLAKKVLGWKPQVDLIAYLPILKMHYSNLFPH